MKLKKIFVISFTLILFSLLKTNNCKANFLEEACSIPGVNVACYTANKVWENKFFLASSITFFYLLRKFYLNNKRIGELRKNQSITSQFKK